MNSSNLFGLSLVVILMSCIPGSDTRQTLGGICEVNDDCGVPFERCESETCVCVEGYQEKEGYCKPVDHRIFKRNIATYGLNCTFDPDCSGQNEECDIDITGTCACKTRYWSSTGDPYLTGCDVYVTHGITCVQPSNCTGPNEDCQASLCACQNGFTSSRQTPVVTGCDAMTFGSACTSDSDCMIGRETCDVTSSSTCVCATGWARNSSTSNCDTYYGVSIDLSGISLTEFQGIQTSFASAVANSTNQYCSSNSTRVSECCNIQTSFSPAGVLQVTNSSLIWLSPTNTGSLKVDVVIQSTENNELCSTAAARRRRKRAVSIGTGFGSLSSTASLALLTSNIGVSIITSQVVQAIQTVYGYTPVISYSVSIREVPTTTTTTTTGAAPVTPQPHGEPGASFPAGINTSGTVFITVITILSLLFLMLIIISIVSCVKNFRRPRCIRVSHSESSTSIHTYEDDDSVPGPSTIVVVDRYGTPLQRPSSTTSHRLRTPIQNRLHSVTLTDCDDGLPNVLS